jgi:MoaA/NifB/PqqE/SkfB family radical SAM enzyme
MSYDAIVARSWNDNQLASVLLELTYRCNLDCFFCYNDLGLRGTPLTFEQYAALLRELASMNVLGITLSGGEPLAHPDFFRIGALARELGFVVRVKSNGHALRGEIARRIRDELDPFVIEVSLHGASPETHDRQTRVPGSFVQLLDNLRSMLELDLRVKVNSTLTAWNEGEARGMYDICDELGLPLRFDLQVTPRDDGDRAPLSIAPTAQGIRNLMRVETERAERLGMRTNDVPSSDPPPASVKVEKHCGAGSSGIAIDPYGNVYPCVAWRQPAGNLHETSLRELWSQSFGAMREQTVEAAAVVRAHPNGRVLNFCPGLAFSLTGSPTEVPEELERIAEVVANAAGTISES